MQGLRHILLVDDDSDDQEIFRSACERVDISLSVSVCASGEQALEELDSTPDLPDLIFLDLNMPRLNGIDVLRTIKSSPSLQHIPVIIYTTSFDGAVRMQCEQLGAIDVIEKPNTFDSLCSVLGVFLHHQ